MSKVFLETSALADLFFKGQEGQIRVRSVLPPAASLVTSRYVLYELSRGFLRYLILLHNKSVKVKKFSDLCRYLSAVRRTAYMAGAITEAFTKYFAEGRKKGAFIIPANADPDEYELVYFRTILRRDIRLGWKKLQSQMMEMIDEIGCRSPIPDPKLDDYEEYKQDLKTKQCGIASACGLRKYIERHRHDFAKLVAALKSIPSPDAETIKRTKALHQLGRQTKDFDRSHCWISGDALIAHECPSNTPLATKNEAHLTPIANVFEKSLIVVKQNRAAEG